MLETTRSCSILLAIGLMAGCGQPAEAPPPSSATFSSTSARKTAAYISFESQILESLQEYIQAILADNPGRLRSVATAELIDRIAMRGPAGDAEAKQSQFVSRERLKLTRELRVDPTADPAPVVASVSLDALTVMADGKTAVASIRLNGRLMPKPIYLLREGQTYRINVVAPQSDSSASSSKYRAQNDDPIIRSFSCSGYSGYWTEPSPHSPTPLIDG